MKGINETPAHESWARVINTSNEEEEYCRLIGSMGLSPYVEHPDIDKTIDAISDKVSGSMLVDLCEATDRGNLNFAAAVTDEVSKALAQVTPVKMGDLLQAEKPLDSTHRAYEWGYSSADTARSAFGIAHDDPSGSAAFFETLKLDLSTGVGTDRFNSSIISGAVERDHEDMRLSVVGSHVAHRKFAAARAAFLAWSQENQSSRLVTTARTRDQQASRAFAAELLVPEKYLHKRLAGHTEVSSFALDEISEEIGAAPAVVYYQARNHGYHVAEAA